jgi:hypothetical protein
MEDLSALQKPIISYENILGHVFLSLISRFYGKSPMDEPQICIVLESY